MKLPLNDKIDITLYTHHSLPLLIPFVHSQTEGWYMNNFINIFYRYEHPSFYDYTDYKCFYSEVMDIDTLTYTTALSLNTVCFFVDCISSEKYIYAWVDQYYISATPYFNREHNVHPILIYGYDTNMSVYHCKCFTVENGVYSADVKMYEYHNALQKATELEMHINDDPVFCIFKIRNDIKCEFSLESFLNELNDYTTGKGKHKGAYFFRGEHIVDSKYNHDVSCYGLKVTSLLAEGLKTLQLRCFDYRVLHMVCENKKNILKRLQYVVTRYANYNINCYKRLVDEYVQIVNEYEKFRLLAMKKSISENQSFYDLNYREETANKLHRIVSDLLKKEWEVLNRILCELADLHVNESYAHKSVQMGTSIGNDECTRTNDECYVDGIVLYSYDRTFKGSLIVNENIIQIDDTRAGNMYYYPIHKKVFRCIWHPVDQMCSGADAKLYVIKDWSNNCKYIASTTYPTDPVFITEKNLGEYADNFWCPEVDDPEPFVELRFDSPMIVNTLVIIQHYVERRVANIQAEAWKNGDWIVIATQKGIDGRQVIRIKFDTITSRRFRIKFTKRIKSENGFDIPNILYMRVYKDTIS